MRFKRAAAAAAVCTLCTSFLPRATAEGAESISTAQEFVSFTEKCVYDDYSKNKKFVLQNDIDLNGIELKPAEVFCGIFEGGGHTIKNISLSAGGSNKGLFCNLTSDAQILDLNVTGTLKVSSDSGAESVIKRRAESMLERADISANDSSDKSSAAGGLVGYNQGKIINCSYSGIVKGVTEVGGIVGFNSMNGLVDSCLSSARVTGDSAVGGIVGMNEGRVKLSKNSGSICPEATDSTSGVGGICGNNEGALVICINEGAVGGDSFGDNVGGISGTQSGEIRECINNGTVSGRRSVGGICGRFEPYTDIDLSYESAKAALEKQAEIFENDINTAREKILEYAVELLGGSGDLSDLMDTLGITDAAEHHRSNLDALTDAAADMMNSASGSVDRIGDASGSLSDFLNGLDGDSFSSSLTDALDSASDLSEDVKQSFRDLDDSLNTTLDSVNTLVEDVNDKSDDISELIENLNTALTDGTDDLSDLASSLQKNMNTISHNISVITGNLDDTHDDIQSLLNKLSKMSSNVSSSVSNKLESLDSAVTGLEEILNNLSDKISSFLESLKALEQQGGASVPSEYYAEEKGYTAVPDGEIEEGYDVEAVMGAAIDLFTATAYAAEDDEEIAISSLKSTDISLPRLIGGESADTALVYYCINNVSVDAAEMAGGIAGSVGFESAVRSGDSITLPDGTKVSADSVLKAVIDSCVSDADITASDKYAGGVCGRSDIGNIRNSLTAGEIRADKENFAGGTAGLSAGDIENCIAINDVYGKDSIGGIAGSANNIKNSYALPRLDGETDKSGAIAGIASGTVEKCYFISEGLSGIDGVSLSGKAEASAPEDMYSEDGSIPAGLSQLDFDKYYMASDDKYMPQIKTLAQNDAENIGALLQAKSSDLALFRFKVSFEDKDKEIKSMSVEYGTILSDSDIPTLTADGSDIPAWDKDVKEPIIRRTTFNAEYNRATSTISTDEEPPALLVEGVFADETTVKLFEVSVNREFDGYIAGDAYSFELNKSAYSPLKVHIRDKRGGASAAAVYYDGKWNVEDCEQDGSYAVFETEKACSFVLLYKKSPIVPVIIITASLSALTAALIFIRRRNKNGKA